MKGQNNTPQVEESCSCRNKNNFPVDGKCLAPNIVKQAQIMSNQLNYKQKFYIGTTKTDFKERFNNHTKSFNIKHYENETELSKEYWTIKCNHFTPKVTSRLMRQCVPCSSIKRNCDLYLNEKFEIAPHKGDKLLSKNSEIINKCRHKRKFTILRHNSKD